MNRVMDELPAYYRDIREFQELTKVQSKQLGLIDEAIQQLEDDQYILTSSEPAIYRREQEFRIVPDRTVETLDFRKKRLLARKQSNPPYVIEYLKGLLDELLGEYRSRVNLDVLRFELDVQVDIENSLFFVEMQKMLERIVPLNIDITTAMYLERTLGMNTFVGGIINEWKRTTIHPIQFHMPSIAGEMHATGYISTWNKHTINPEVKHKWLITRVLY